MTPPDALEVRQAELMERTQRVGLKAMDSSPVVSERRHPSTKALHGRHTSIMVDGTLISVFTNVRGGTEEVFDLTAHLDPSDGQVPYAGSTLSIKQSTLGKMAASFEQGDRGTPLSEHGGDKDALAERILASLEEQVTGGEARKVA